MLYTAGHIIQLPWGPRADRYGEGKRLRKKVPRERHADLLGTAARDAVAILAAGDRSRVPELIPVRYERMLASPFAFLRGAAAVMAEDLRHQPMAGIAVQACGDCHLMNFGAFATPEDNVVFDINDFDETLAGVDFTGRERRRRGTGGQAPQGPGAGARGGVRRSLPRAHSGSRQTVAIGNLAQQDRSGAGDRAHRGPRAQAKALRHRVQGRGTSRTGRQLSAPGKGQAAAHPRSPAAHLSFHGKAEPARPSR